MNTLRYENHKFEEIAKLIVTTAREVDVTESVDTFKKKKAFALMADYIELYPKLFAQGFRYDAIMDELLSKHNITLMTFRNFITREGVPMSRLKKMAAWSYRKKMAELDKISKEQ